MNHDHAVPCAPGPHPTSRARHESALVRLASMFLRADVNAVDEKVRCHARALRRECRHLAQQIAVDTLKDEALWAKWQTLVDNYVAAHPEIQEKDLPCACTTT